MSIRELALIGVIVVIVIASLFRPKYALHGYVWYALMRPDIAAYVENKYPFSLILAAFVALAVVRRYQRLICVLRSSGSRTLLLLQIPLALSYVFAVDPKLSEVRYFFFLKMITALFAIPILLETLDDLKEFLLVMIASLGFIAAKFGLYGLLHGGVTIPGYGDVLGDNNFIALVLAMLVPLAWQAQHYESTLAKRLPLVLIICTSMVAVIMSNSRGGSLSLALGLLFLLARARHKVIIVPFVGFCLASAIYIVKDTYIKRMETLSAVQDEGSAASRIVHAKAAFKMWQDYPLVGVGFGGMNYAILAPLYADLDGGHVAHNTYLQMLVDSGAIALVMYVWMLVSAIRRMGRSARTWEKYDSRLAAVPRGIQISLAVFLLGATFYSCQRMDFPYMVLLCSSVWETVSKEREADRLEAVIEREDSSNNSTTQARTCSPD